MMEHRHTADAETGTECETCNIPIPKPCNWGEQCGEYQRRKAEWLWTFNGEALE